MIHASVELLEAVKGVAPGSVPVGLSPDWVNACGAPMGWDDVRRTVKACEGFAAERTASRDPREVTCPACLLLLREATPAVRWDFLEARGLVAL